MVRLHLFLSPANLCNPCSVSGVSGSVGRLVLNCVPSFQVAAAAVECAATPGVAAAGEGAEALAGGHGPRCPLLKSWMLSLTPMSTRSTSEVIGGQQWRPSSSSSSSGECKLPWVGCGAAGPAALWCVVGLGGGRGCFF